LKKSPRFASAAAQGSVRAQRSVLLPFERGGRVPAADEPMKLDPYLVEWILGSRSALDHDPRARRLARPNPWAGASLLNSEVDDARALATVTRTSVTTQNREEPQWVVLSGEAPSVWRALLERGSQLVDVALIRVEAGRATGLDSTELEDAGSRLGRLARLTGRPLIVDIGESDAGSPDDDSLRILLHAIGRTAVRCGMICSDVTRAARMLEPMPLTLVEDSIEASTRASHLLNASKQLGLQMTEAEQRLERFISACQDVATEGASKFAQRIQPTFDLSAVILPPDRSQQLLEIVNNVLWAPKVLDDWKFRDQLPYGRGVGCLFHGPSGTGKTMASLAVAKRLGHTGAARGSVASHEQVHR
jgi:hypothetical protein